MKEADNPTRLFASIKSLAANGRRNAESSLYEVHGLAEAGELMSERFTRERDTALRNERATSEVLIRVHDYARAVAGSEAALPSEIVREIEKIIRGHETPKVSKMKPALEELLRRAKAHYDAMTPEEKEAMHAEQRESFLRGMAPCEHGERDWETCPDCRREYGGSDVG